MKVNYIYCFLLFTACVLINTGCKKSTEANPSEGYINATEYYPLKIGSWWKYDQYETDKSGNKHFVRTATVKLDSVVNGACRFNRTDETNKLLAYWLVYPFRDQIEYSSERALFNTDYISSSDTLKSHILYTEVMEDSSIITDRLYEGEREVKTPAGNFKAIMREFTKYGESDKYNYSLLENEYFAKGIGTVKRSEIYTKRYDSDTVETITEYLLKEYHLEK